MSEIHKEPVEILNRTNKIVMMAMAIALVALTIVSILVTFEARSTQINADAATRFAEQVAEQNAKLHQELTCLRQPAFEADKADSELSIITARGLAAVALGQEEVLANLSQNLTEGADNLERALAARETSIENCDET